MEDANRPIAANEFSVEESPDGGNLSPVADQLVAIAEKLRTGDMRSVLEPMLRAPKQGGVAAAHSKARPSHPDASALAEQRRQYADMARQTYDIRRTRGTIFGDPDLFGEPAWDILLDLYVAHSDGKAVSVSSACIGSAAPPTTGLRWLGVLAQQEFVVREQDPEDQRRVLVRLTEHGLTAMDRYFADVVKRTAA